MEHAIAMYEVQEHVAVVEEAEMGAAEVKRSLHRRVEPGPVCLCCCRDFPPVLSPMRAGEVRQRARPGGLPIHRHHKFVPRVWSVIAAQDFLVRCLADGCGEVLCQTNLNALGELEMCYDVYISRQSPFLSVTHSYGSQKPWPLHSSSQIEAKKLRPSRRLKQHGGYD